MSSLRNMGFGTCLLSLTACAVGPAFEPPTTTAPATYGSMPGIASDRLPDPAWWHEFNDAQLDQLEARTQTGNLDLQSGLLRIAVARFQVQTARARGLPSLNATASVNREQLGLAGILKAQGGGGAFNPALVTALTSPINLFQLGFDASWELDLFGKVSRSVEAARAQSDEAVETRNDMMVSLEAEVAQTYLQMRGAQLLRSISDGLIADQQQITDLITNRQAHGLAEQADVESASAQLANLRAGLPLYEQNIALSRHALAVLVGQSPEALDDEFALAAPLPDRPQMIPVGLPSTLARRRPDVRQAEAALHAATAEVGVSIASLYPDVSLSGTVGLRNVSARYLFDWASKFYSAGPAVSLPIFHGGAGVANIKVAKAVAGEAAIAYRKTVLTALQEVEDALVSLDQDRLRLDALRDTVAANQRSYDLVAHAYKAGLASYISVLTQQLQTNEAKQQLAQASLSELTDLVKLYKSLGGGWQIG